MNELEVRKAIFLQTGKDFVEKIVLLTEKKCRFVLLSVLPVLLLFPFFLSPLFTLSFLSFFSYFYPSPCPCLFFFFERSDETGPSF